MAVGQAYLLHLCHVNSLEVVSMFEASFFLLQEYGAQSTALAPKPAAPPPIPPTKRVSAPPTPEPMTNIDDVTLTPEQEEELKQLQIRMTDSSQVTGYWLDSRNMLDIVI